MTTIDVVHCGEIYIDGRPGNQPCPFHRLHGFIDEHCSLIDRRIYGDDPERPEWCPLGKADALIKLRVTNPEQAIGQGTILMNTNNVPEKAPLELCLRGEDKVIAYACATCRIVALDQDEARFCCERRPCKRCGAPAETRHALICRTCREQELTDHDAKLHAELEAKAKRVLISEYKFGWVSTDPHGEEGSYLTVADAIERGLEWAWGCESQPWPTFDVEEFVRGRFEDGYPEDAHEHVDMGPLQRAVDEWVSSLGECRFFIADETTLVDLRALRENHECADANKGQ